MSQLVNAIHDLISDLPRPWRLHKLRALRLLVVRGVRQDRAWRADEAEFFPLAAITRERAALRLAVLHDAMCSCVTVSPWCDRPLVRAVRPVVTQDASYPAVLLDAEGPPLVSSGQTWNALRFAGLLNQVHDLAQNELWGDGPSLTAGQEQAIREWVADVRIAVEKVVGAWRGQAVRTTAKAQEPDGATNHLQSPDPAPPEALLILKALAGRQVPTLRTNLAKTVKRNEKTLRPKIDWLLRGGYVHTPFGPKKGLAITTTGKNLLTRIESEAPSDAR